MNSLNSRRRRESTAWQHLNAFTSIFTMLESVHCLQCISYHLSSENLVLNQTMPLSLIFLFSHRTAAENFYYWYCLEKLLLDHFWEKRSWSRLKCNTWVTWCKQAGTIVCKILLKVFKLAFLCVPIALDMTALNLSSRKFASFRLCSFALND